MARGEEQEWGVPLLCLYLFGTLVIAGAVVCAAHPAVLLVFVRVSSGGRVRRPALLVYLRLHKNNITLNNSRALATSHISFLLFSCS